MLQGVSRHSWESLQTNVGSHHSNIRNIFNQVDHVKYFGGTTFAINENDKRENRWFRGLSLGNFISINIDGPFDENFPGSWIYGENGLYWHEYGHTFQSERFGLFYLFAVGIPSKNGAEWTETSANRWAWKYANKYGFMNNWPQNWFDYPLE